MDWKDEEVETTCEAMHDAYEEAAVVNGWATQERSRKPWADVPESNRATMRVAVRIAMTRAVELRAARGGTMTGEEIVVAMKELRDTAYNAPWPEEIRTKDMARLDAIDQHISALGARNAVLEKERDDLRAEVERLKVEQERRLVEFDKTNEACRQAEVRAIALEQHISALGARNAVLEKERDDLRAEVERLKARCAALSAAGQVLSAHVDKAGGCANPDPLSGQTCAERGCEGGACRYSTPSSECDHSHGGIHTRADGVEVCVECNEPIRYPCSPTCTHDDAATSGHPERVKEQNVKMARAALGLPERVKERHGVPTWRCSGDAPECSPGCPEHGVGRPTERVKERSEAVKRPEDDNDAALTEEYAKGAEAMRAACWEAVQAWIQREGLEAFENDVKAAIEGAKP